MTHHPSKSTARFPMFLRCLGLFLALFIPVAGQEKEPAKKSEAAIQVKFLAEEFPENLGKVQLVFGDLKSAAFSLPVNHLSDPVPASARSMLLKMVDKDITLCPITLPENGNAFAVILVTAKPAGFKPIVVRTDDPTFKAGDVFFINKSERIVLGRLGTTALVLNPGDTAKSHPTGAVENTYYDIAFATREEGGDKLMSSTRWPIDNNLRSYLFFFTNAQGKTTFRAVDEYLIPSATAKP